MFETWFMVLGFSINWIPTMDLMHNDASLSRVAASITSICYLFSIKTHGKELYYAVYCVFSNFNKTKIG
jgi:hypothetical protein